MNSSDAEFKRREESLDDGKKERQAVTDVAQVKQTEFESYLNNLRRSKGASLKGY